MSSSLTMARSTVSSLSSTFSDVSEGSSSSSAASSPPPSSKTHAFFASSFAVSPPPPRPPLSFKKVVTTAKPDPVDVASRREGDSPSIFSSAKSSRFNVSRIFPSRYTRSRRDSSEQNDVRDAFASNALRRKPEFLFIDADPSEMDHIPSPSENSFNDIFLPLPTAQFYHERTLSESSVSPPSSISSSSSHADIHLPTPPPAPPLLMASSGSFSDNDSEFTPRPTNLEPTLSALQIQLYPPQIQSTHPDPEPHEGDVISNSNLYTASPSLRLVKPLGQGAFSAVWLAEDLSPVPLTLSSKKSVRDLKRQASLQSKGSLSRRSSQKSSTKGVSRNSSLKKFKARVTGMQPSVDSNFLDAHSLDDGERRREIKWGDEESHGPPSSSSTEVSPHHPTSPLPLFDLGLSPSLSRQNSANGHSSESRVVAVKLTPRRPDPHTPQAEERTRVGFVREVEILRHISHPNITPLLSFFSTPNHHVLVLPCLKGGDLLTLVNNDAAWGTLSESVLRRLWCELCRAVGWMHSVGLVHRDIKLENILLTWDGLATNAAPEAADQASTTPTNSQVQIPLSQLEHLPTPLIKLTDFGLSRFIDIGNGERGQGEMVSTRCGSEAYAAPELVMGGGPRGVYDARETDAWACGVVLYALVGRRLPFGEGVGVDGARGNTSRIGGERFHAYGPGSRKHAIERRAWLMKIARGEYQWPEPEANVVIGARDGGELVGPRLALSEGAKRVAGRLLVRDPKKRARIADLWEDEWMRADLIGEGVWESLQEQGSSADQMDTSASMPLSSDRSGELKSDPISNPITRLRSQDDLEILGEDDWEPLAEDDDDLEEEQEGWLLDEESIGSIARQEVV